MGCRVGKFPRLHRHTSRPRPTVQAQPRGDEGLELQLLFGIRVFEEPSVFTGTHRVPGRRSSRNQGATKASNVSGCLGMPLFE